MSYLVLARKWRPRSFETLVGQEHVVRALAHALREGRLHHAYLFTGTRGIGKTTIARILAKALNCETGVTPTPCGACSACVEIDSGRFVDLLEVDAATNTRVDEMRQLLENAVYAPTRGRYKVYVIDEVHMLSNAAFNAMLKTLEEPPEHVKFILATTDPQKIPVTVLSRCLQFNLKQMPQGAIADHLERVLQAEKISAEPAALRLIARAANGSMRDALSLLDQAIAHGAGRVADVEVRAMLGTIGDDFIHAIVDALLASDAPRLHEVARTMEARSLSFDSALAAFCELMVRVQVGQLAPSAIDPADPDAERVSAYAAAMPPEYVQLAYEIALQGRSQLPFAPDHGAGFIMTLLRLHAFAPQSGSAVLPVEAEKKSPLSGDPASAERVEPVAPVAPGVPAVKSAAAPARFLEPVEGGVPPETDDDDPVADAADWAALVGRLQLTGMVRELAQNCELVRYSADRVELRLAAAHRHLLTRTAQDRIQQAVAALPGCPARVDIVVGEAAGASPAALADRVRREERESAIAAIESDPAVREMVELLDATINESSIAWHAADGAAQGD